MPLTFDDREDLYIEIERLRRSVERLERALESSRGEIEYWKSRYDSLLLVSGVLHGRKM